VIVRVALLLAALASAGFAQQNAGFPVAGKIVDAQSGAALAGVEVQLSPVLKPQLSEAAISSANGEFRFDGVPAGKYMLAAARRRYLSEYYLQHENYNTGIAVGPKLDATNIIFPLHASAAIFGRVVDEDNEPVPNARVEVVRQGIVNGMRSAYVASTTSTGDDGRYRAANLPPGTYLIAVVAQPWFAPQIAARFDNQVQSGDEAKLDVTYPITFYPDARSDTKGAPVALSSGSQVEADFLLQTVPAARLMLTNSASGGQKTAGVYKGGRLHNSSLNLITRSGLNLQLGPAYFSPQGVFFYAAPGLYTVHASWADSSGQHSVAQAVELRGKGETVDLASFADSLTITAAASEGGSALSGQASSLALRNLANGQILPATPAGNGWVTWANHRLDPGNYEVVLTNINGYYIQQITASNARVTHRVVEFTGKAPVELKVSLGQGEASIAGRVKRDATPVAGAMVLLLPQDLAHAPSLVRRDQSDSDGTFSLTNVVPGRYTLLALPADENLEYANPQVMQRYLASGTPVNVSTGGKYEATAEMIQAHARQEQSP
jgi:hypothetical protein